MVDIKLALACGEAKFHGNTVTVTQYGCGSDRGIKKPTISCGGH